MVEARRSAGLALVNQATALADEQVMLLRYREFFAVFTGLLGCGSCAGMARAGRWRGSG